MNLNSSLPGHVLVTIIIQMYIWTL